MSSRARNYMTVDGPLYRAVIQKPGCLPRVIGPYPTKAPARAAVNAYRKAGYTAVFQSCRPVWVDDD